MKHASTFTLHPGLRILLKDLGLSPAFVLKRAKLPEDLFSRGPVQLPSQQYFDLWRGIEAEAEDPGLALRLGSAISVEVFDAPIFAALCSEDLKSALRCLSRFKRLMGPMALHLKATSASTTVELEWLDEADQPPAILVASELVFFVQLARIATREQIKPLRVTTSHRLRPASAYRKFLGCEVTQGKRHIVQFSAHDAERPLLTANQAMWNSFLPELSQRLAQLDPEATWQGRTRAALLELLPSAQGSINDVSKKLALSARTLQRRLKSEGTTFREVLDQTREHLARHYLTNTTSTQAEIAFLLGFETRASFSRAFRTWTGLTPDEVRGDSAPSGKPSSGETR